VWPRSGWDPAPRQRPPFRRGQLARWPCDSYLSIMSTHTVAEAKNQLSKLIDRALKGEGIVITAAASRSSS
jgi:hypothetical protein